MFNVYVPEPIYERLPKIYLLLAALLIAAPLAQIKWMAVAALLMATLITRHQRQIYREASRMREALKLRQNLQYEPTYAIADAELSRTFRTGLWKSMPLPSRTDRKEKTDLYRTVMVPATKDR